MSIKKYGLREFEDLQTSTRTIMVYTNILFDHEKIFRGVDITDVEVPRTKKKKNVDKKNLKAPYGSIISIHKGDKYRGINLRKTKLRYCSICQPIKENMTDYLSGQKQKKINTVIERTLNVKNTDIQEIHYYCDKCHKQFVCGELDKTPTHFLNQITIVLSLKNTILNIMLFKDSFKIAGCKNNDDAVEATMVLWQDYISKIKESYQIKDDVSKGIDPHFLFQLVMRNVDFRLGFPIDRQKLNQLMNNKKYHDKICMSQCEPTGNTNVNIKMYSKKPKDYRYDCLVMPLNKEEPYFKKLQKNPYRIKKRKKPKHTTFIVFSSSEVILSGRYEENMKQMYEFFVSEAFENKEFIEERILQPKESLRCHLQKVGYEKNKV